MNLLDLIMFLVVAVIAIISAKKGFLMALFNIISFVISGFLARIFSSPVSAYVYDGYCREKIIAKMYEIMPSGSVEGEISKVVLDTLESLPEFVMSMINRFDIINLNDLDTMNSGANLTVEAIEQTYLEPVMLKVISVVAIIVLFVIFAVILKFVFSLINKLLTRKKHKIIRGTNMLLGAALGAVKGSFIAGVICAVLNIAAPALNNETLNEFVGGSAICNIIAQLLN